MENCRQFQRTIWDVSVQSIGSAEFPEAGFCKFVSHQQANRKQSDPVSQRIKYSDDLLVQLYQLIH